MMNKNVEDYLAFGEKTLTAKELFADLLHAACLGLVANLLSSGETGLFLLLLSAFLVMTVALGINTLKRTTRLNGHLYRGVSGTGIAAIYFILSHAFLTLAGGGGAASAVAYAAVFLLLGTAYILGIRRLIRKGVYSNPQKPQSTAAAHSGAVLALLLCPFLFQGMAQKASAALLAACALLLGICMLLSVNELIKTFLLLKQSKHKPQ